MSKQRLQVIKNEQEHIAKDHPHDDPRAYNDHHHLVARYLQSHRIRNHSAGTIKKEEAFLHSWFLEHGNTSRPLYCWEAMEPVRGRKRILDYGDTLLKSELSASTVRAYLGILSRFFSYVLEFPYLGENENIERITHRYGTIEQPVSEFDLPTHIYNGEKLGVPFDPEKLYEFYATVRNKYLGQGQHKSIRARNYAMVVLAGESGLRIDELLHIELVDLFFESNKIQTRWAKGTRGSGKRSRVTLFTPLARDSVKYYLNQHRPKILGASESDLLFVSKSGCPLTYTPIHEALKEMIKIANKAQFPVADHMSFHWLRRIFATRFIEKFPNQLAVLVSLLGHMTPNTVHCYIRHSEAWMDKKILEMLEKGGRSWPSIGD